ncbi:2-hydroxychromene-2-carboxylate isomerase [Psychrobacter sp. DAB_AL62B]|uniref:2-hydroxychromene-2-carboxylate isomerase n=1 Tax=Psychrobacter sp. DAB_AL62B TaxID=1028420 RepID=UPI002380FA25|nr:2-hydroxychromene-2-carboxylate isomerase [Psychrobacter sp. DAB_AL62B]MDE4454835.1 2-hydroxychromene-2-carboxylate isomerase [Psychrobacter sp. DAB_AL62B]
MSKKVEFFFDVGSPASYLAWTQLESMAQRTNAKIIWRPMLLGAVFQATGNASPAAVPAKGPYMLKDLQRFSNIYGVPFNFNPFFPLNTMHLMRGATAYLEEPEFLTYLAAIFNALWSEKLNMESPEVVAEVLTKAGIDVTDFMARISETEVKERLKDTTEEAVARGVFGAPSFFVNGEMFFGQDRLSFVETALKE